MSLTRSRVIQYIGILMALGLIAAGYWYFAVRAGVKTNTSGSQPQGVGDLSAGLMGYWKLDENTGTSAADASTNGINGTLTNGPTWTTGQIGSAVSFDGSNDYINTSDSDVYAPETISAFAWVKRSASNGRIFSKDNGALQRDFELKIDSSNNVEFTVWNQAGSPTTVNGGSTVDTNWHLVGGTWDGTTVRTYLDGVEQNSGSLSGTSVFNGTDPLEIGRYSFNTEYFTGLMDELRLYDRVLSTDEIVQLYRLTAPTGVDTGLKGYWSFDGGALSGTTAYDRSGAGNTGTLTNGPTVTEGKLGQALDFDGTGDYIDAGSASSLDSIDTLSTCAWIYPNTAGELGTDRYGGIFSKVSAGSGFWIGITDDTGSNKPFLYQGFSGTDGGWYSASATIPLNQWTHFCVTLDSSSPSNDPIFYLDGVAVALTESATPSGTVTHDTDAALRIGTNDTGTQDFDGKIDEARVYNRILTTAEVRVLYDRGASDKTNTSAGQAQGTGGLDSGLIGYWKLDENTGTSAADSSTNGNAGTLTNMENGDWTTGRIGNGLTFDGTNEYINMGDLTIVDGVTQLTVSAWAKSSSLATERSIVTKSSCIGTSDSATFQLGAGNSANYAEFVIYPSGGTPANYYNVTASTTMNDGNWHLVTGVYDGANIRIYMDGVLSATAVAAAGDLSANTRSVQIGACSGGNLWNDMIDEVRLYDRALSADEIGQLYRLTTPTAVDTGLKGYWSFNGQDLSGTAAYDRSGAGNTGTLTNGPAIVEGRVGQSLQFDGSNDDVVASDAAALDITGTATLSAWVKKDAHPTAGDWDTVVMKGTVAAGTTNYALKTYGANSTEYLAFYFYNGTDQALRGSTPIELGQWYHLAVTYDDVANSILLYVDGVLQSETTVFGSPEATSIITNAQSLYIGDYGGSTRRFSGSIDEVRVYNRILSAAEIKSQYDAAAPDKTNTSVSTPQGTGRLDSGLVGYWKLDENTGTSAADASTNGNTGTLTNGPTWTTGQIGSAVDFDGVDDYITTSSVRGVVNASISVWIRPDSVTGTHTAIRHDNNFGIDLVDDEIRWYWEGGSAYHNTTAANLTTGQWYHIVGTYFSGGSSDNVQVYLNGVAQVLNNNDETSTPSGSSGVVANSWLGAYYDGLLDEIRIYNRTLSADEAAQLYRLTAPTSVETSLKGYWSFNGQDLSGTTAYDRSGAGNNGTLANSPTVTEGKIGQALNFDGSTQKVTSGVNDYPLDTFTESFWVKTSGTITLFTESNSLSGNSDGATGQKFALMATRAGGSVSGATVGSGVSVGTNGIQVGEFTTSYFPILASYSGSLDTGWNHIAVVYNNKTPSIYLNGQLVRTGLTSQRTGIAPSYILAEGEYGDFAGSIDEFRIYNRVLSASEIKALYSSGK